MKKVLLITLIAGMLIGAGGCYEEQPKKHLRIHLGWVWERAKDGRYSYIRGRVKNIGDTTVSSFSIIATYKDARGMVLDVDSDYLYEPMKPGWSKEFEIMHKDRTEYIKVSLHVQDVSTSFWQK